MVIAEPFLLYTPEVTYLVLLTTLHNDEFLCSGYAKMLLIRVFFEKFAPGQGLSPWTPLGATPQTPHLGSRAPPR